ncbi:MAG: hypothetical protein A3D67_03160 [Candidatus Lloydbacteria bacterium RIFCSPHIGHO2_02_FULL_51_22]|uniref:AI-2E family transporter n=3 Tax=Candidatus Lloydiibacteriota TaxID=1817910 RepID=A0A1G2DA68_9BACT|nr:MAG: hypothetical protein A3D67_03160 [Candidatus Lloydbacteria bacterium RIFCSPHIGHO2_02_FULL_51_22]OGZ15633.1 MAG: hypothetical protein A3J08_00350 [Candidatus Lloydbacteria bacterium RIFCSPLOWO2_02_FULL_51_11]OGZ15976.1 MAG: hypothetical protein A3G11_01305 [Candidatus Lloydbacteria bacterium RIFCSPLOWO2_12_FULL_51_9]
MKNALHITIAPETIVKAILVALAFWLLYILRDLVLVVLAAVVIASAIEPFTAWFMRWRIPRSLAVILIYLLLIVGLLGLFYFFIPPLLNDISGALSVLSRYLEGVSLTSPITAGIEGEGVIAELSRDFSVNRSLTEIRGALGALSSGFLETASIVFGGIFSFILIIVLSFYLAVQERGIENFLRLVAPLRHEKYVMDLWRRAQAKIGLWMQGQLFLGFFIGALVFLGLSVLGVRHALFLAVLAAAFELIPLFGPKIAAVPAVLIAFLESTPLGLIVLGLYLIIDQFESHLIYPLVVRKVVGIQPIMVILALIIGGKLAGFLGIILAVPLTTVLLEMLNDFEKGKAAEQVRAHEGHTD